MSHEPPTALIADDEEAPRAQLRPRCTGLASSCSVVAEAANGVDAWDAFLEHEPPVLSRHPHARPDRHRSGAAHRRPRGRWCSSPPIGDHALAAFDAGAVDYVMKPVDPERLAQAVARLQPGWRSHAPWRRGLQALLAQLAGQAASRPRWT
jgi:DNA-binding LytR/AlgR family response regulator